MTKLKPCPFCGKNVTIGSLGGDKENWAIWCETCLIPCVETGCQGKTKKDIIKIWNSRKINEIRTQKDDRQVG